MSIINQQHSLSLPPRSQEARIGSAHSAPWRRNRSRLIRRRRPGVPPVMGPPNHAPGIPVMGAPNPWLHLKVMGGSDIGPRLDPMGGPDAGPRADLMGDSDPTFVDSLFTHRRNFLWRAVGGKRG